MNNNLINKSFFIVFTVLITLFTGCKDDVVVENNNGNNNQDPTAPQLSEPQNNSVVSVSTPLLKWSEFPNTSQYRVQLSMDANFISALFVDSTLTGTELQVRDNILTTGINFYWRVMSLQNGSNTGWSVVWSFKVILSPPAAPELQLPSNNSLNQSFTPVFDWNDVTTAETYRLQISSNIGFTSILFDSSAVPSSQMECPPMYLNTNTQYWWRVNASNSNGVSTGEWSSPFSFTTLDGPEPNSISGTITFADANFIHFPNHYGITLYLMSGWPPSLQPFIAVDSLIIQQNNGIYIAQYKLRRIPNGIYYAAAQIMRGSQPLSVTGTYGCDTTRVIYSPCAFTPQEIIMSGNNGITGINFLSWADSTKPIFSSQTR